MLSIMSRYRLYPSREQEVLLFEAWGSRPAASNNGSVGALEGPGQDSLSSAND
jgi:hypothetical protein